MCITCGKLTEFAIALGKSPRLLTATDFCGIIKSKQNRLEDLERAENKEVSQ